MKRIVLAAICLLVCLLAGCTDVNQTNSFVDLSPPPATGLSEAAVTPELTPPPAMQTNALPTSGPMYTPAPATISPTPEESPGEFGGFNG